MSGKLMSDKFRALSFTAKIQYIWEFYKLRITIVVLSIALGTAIIHGVATNNRKPLYCAVFNDLNNEKIENRVKEKYSEYTGCKKNDIKVDTGYGFKMSDEYGYNRIDAGSSIRFMSVQSAKEMDVIITDRSSLLWVKSEGFLVGVKDVLPENLYKKLEPYFVYARFEKETDKDKNDGVVYGLDISDTEFYKGYSDNYKDAVIAFPEFSKNKEAAVKFVKCVYGIKE